MSATSSSLQVGTSSPSVDFDLRNLASCNLIPCLEVDKAPSEIQIMVEFLCHHDLNIPLTREAEVPISLIQRAYHTARYFKKEDCVKFNVDAKNSMNLDKSRFLEAIGFPDLPKEERNIEEPSNDELFDMFEKMNYLGGRLERTIHFKKLKLPAVWHYLVHIILRCLSGKTGGTDTLNRGYLCILYSLYYDKDVDIGDILWKDFTYFIELKKADIRYGRFWGLILQLCYKELKLEMPKGELTVFRPVPKFTVPDQSCFGVVNPIPEEMLKYIPTTSTVLSSYLKAMDQSKSAEPSQAAPSGKGNTKRQKEIGLGTTSTVTGTLKREHESSHKSPVKRPTKKPTPPIPSQQGDVRGRKATEESLKRIEEERQKKIFLDDSLAPEDESSHSGFTLFTKINDENKILLDASSAKSAKRSEEIKDSQGTSEGLSKSRKRSKGSKYVSKKKFKRMEKSLNDVLEFVKHINDTVISLSKTVEDMNARQKKHGHSCNRQT